MVESGILHSHSIYSLYDATQTVDQLVSRAKEMGASAIALTDHGTLLGIPEFMNACKKAEIKGIPGVEAYMQDPEDEYLTRGHLELYPVNDEGYKEICKIITDSEAKKEKVGTTDYPITTSEIIKKYVKPNGNVMAGTACVGGYVALPLLWNINLQEKIERYKRQLDEEKIPNPSDEYFQRLLASSDKLKNEIEQLDMQKLELKAISEKKFAKKKKAVKALPAEERCVALKQIAEEEKESDLAKEKLSMIKDKIKNKKEVLKIVKNSIEKEQKGHGKWNHINKMIELLESEKVPFEKLKAVSEKNLQKLISLFGKENLYVEIQYHNLYKEEIAFNILIEFANKYGLKLIAANDAHMDVPTENNIKKRQILMAERFNSWSENGPDASEYYLKSDEELREKLLEVYDCDTVEAAFKGIRELCERSNVKYELGKHYPKAIVPEGYTAGEYLRKLAYEGVPEKYPDGLTEKDKTKLEHELKVIDSMGFSDYLLIVQDYVNYARKQGMKSPEGHYIQYMVGPGRGSGGGSIVNYLIGITSIDPIKYGLMFERFLNPERVSMPDIDVDFEPKIRIQMFDYVKQKYGKKATCQISTIGYQLAKGAIRKVAKVLADKDAREENLEKNDKKALEKSYYNIATAITKKYSELEENEGKKEEPQKCSITLFKNELTKAFCESAKACEIIEYAALVEETPVQLGAHSAGCIISDNSDVTDYVPLRYTFDDQANRDVWAAQCNMVQAESDMGLIKMDFLGLNTLAVISEACMMIYERYGKSYDLDNLPFEPEVFENIFAVGNTTGIFQFSSPGMRNTLKDFKPTCFEDIILLNAAYRPGPMKYIPDLIKVKDGQAEKHYMVPQMADILDITYGKPVYQEQVIALFHQIAGFTMGKADIIRRYMSKKKPEKFMKYKDEFIDGCVANGAVRSEAITYWEEIVDFSKYAFNKSHAATYSIVAYQTAWLKYHYPKEFFCAILNNPDNKEEENKALIAKDCKELGIRILPPDINIGKVGYQVIDDNTIMMGFASLKGVGKSAAEELVRKREIHGGQFTSFKDYILNGNTDKKILEAVIKIDSFKDICENRTAMMQVYPDLIKIAQLINSTAKNLKETEDEEKKANLKMELESLKEQFIEIKIPDYLPENDFSMIEKDIAGFYVNGSPLDKYPSPETAGTKSFTDITDGMPAKVMGFVENVVERTDKNGETYAFLTLSDGVRDLKAVCWSSVWKKIKNDIATGKVLIFSGKGELHDWNDTQEMQLIIKDSSEVRQKGYSIIIHCRDIIFWSEKILPIAEAHMDPNGLDFVVHDRITNEYRQGTFRVSTDFMSIQNNIEGIRIDTSF